MKLGFLVNPKPEGTETLVQFLKGQGYSVLSSKIPDEITQAGLQAQRLILIFDDAKYGYQFLTDNKWNGFQILSLLYLPKTPKLNPEAVRMLSSVALEIFVKGHENELLEKLKKFESNASTDDSFDIEFNIHNELEKD